MIIPDRLVVGVACRAGPPPPGLDLVEFGEALCDLPDPASIRAAAAERAVTLVAWHVMTHRRSDPRYRAMASPIPEHAAVGHFERSRWTDEAWERTDFLARAVGAEAVVFQTPASFKPSGEHAIRLENFIAQAMRPGLTLAWEPEPGSWPHRKVVELADRIGVVPVADPIEDPIPDGEYLYLRARGGRSGRKVLRDDDLKKVALQVRDRIGWVVFANATATQDAERLVQML